MDIYIYVYLSFPQEYEFFSRTQTCTLTLKIISSWKMEGRKERRRKLKGFATEGLEAAQSPHSGVDYLSPMKSGDRWSCSFSLK